MPSLSIDQIVQHLKGIQKTLGEEQYRAAVRELAQTFVNDSKGEIFLKTFILALDADWLDLEELRKAPPVSPQMPNMADMIRQMVPSISTQGQYDLYMAAFQTLSLLMDAYYSRRFEEAVTVRDKLMELLDRAPKVADLVEKAAEIPVDQQSENLKSMIQPPAQFSEAEDQRRLLAELESLTSTALLNTWYAGERARIDKVVTKRYRDELFDAIRAKKAALSN